MDINSKNEIKEIRKSYGLTQKTFSEITHISKRTIENWEVKNSYPKWLPSMIKAYLKEYYDVTILE